MANAGYSSDHKLCEAITRGLWTYKGRVSPISIPKHNDSDDEHQIVLKNYLIDYYNAFFAEPQTGIFDYWKIDKTKRNRSLNKIIYQMNQYRQKHWYWKAII